MPRTAARCWSGLTIGSWVKPWPRPAATIPTRAKLVDSDTRVCVIGTHIGSLLVPIAKRVVGYEANPDTFKLLELNARINDLTNVCLHNLAVGDKQGKIEFYANTVNSGGSKIKPKNDLYAYHYDQPRTVTIDMVALDQHSDETFDLILMDIEGAEYLALKGMAQKLGQCQHLQLEYIPQHLANIAEVSNSDFLATFADYFTTARIMGDAQKTFGRNQFACMRDDLRDRNQFADLIFSK
jgi:FkbM family methyltransferase